jgi:hypothetical protein
MTDPMHQGRRAVVGGLGAGLLLGLASAPEPCGAGDRGDGLADLFSTLPSARAIGAAYLRSCVDDAPGPATLAAELPAGETVAALREAVAERVRNDFANGRVVTVDGWLLARTEVRLCALAYLVA